jgi:hypothetical protein
LRLAFGHFVIVETEMKFEGLLMLVQQMGLQAMGELFAFAVKRQVLEWKTGMEDVMCR